MQTTAQPDQIRHQPAALSRQCRQLQALLELHASPVLAFGDLNAILRLVTETTAATLEVERVSIWRYDASPHALVCLDLFERQTGGHSTGIELAPSDYPEYFAALWRSNLIPAHSAAENRHTGEVAPPRLKPLDVASMLDVAIRIAGEIEGVLCLEQVSTPRVWHPSEESFARAVASLVARTMAEKQRHEAHAALLASEHRYRALFAACPLPTYVFDTRTLRFLAVSDALVARYGFSRDELLQMTIVDIRPPEEESRLRTAIAHLSPHNSSMGIWQHRTKNGTLLDVEVNAQLIEFDGLQAGLVLTVDRTDQLKMERALRENNERLREMAENIGEVFWMKDPVSRRMLYLSPAFTTIWGRPAEEFYGTADALLTTINPLDQERMAALMAGPVTAKVSVRYRIQRPDGTERWIQDRAFPVRDTTGRVVRVVGVAEDVTERELLEQNFLRAQRMESLGRLAGGIAHDLNNILAPVLMAAPLLRASRERDPAVNARIIDTVESSAHRGAALVKQLLLFGRGTDGEHVALRLKDAVQELAAMLHETLPKNCELSSDIPRELWLVQADATQMHQVLLNLCVNACDAMPKGGHLAITAENRILTEWDARPILDARPGPYVLLRVIDSGTGIPAGLLDKIFDPFFTTKALGKGTGLGLATVASIVKNHGGFVTVQSEPGLGTTFCLGLPAFVDMTTLAAAQTAGDNALPPPGNGEEVLIVDDEEAIRSMLQEVLTHQGYVVHTATGGVDGAAIFVKQAARLRLVLADLNMPHMDGLAMLQLIRRVSPIIPLIVLSGTVSGEYWAGTRSELEQLGVKAILPKPFSARHVLTALHDALAPQAA